MHALALLTAPLIGKYDAVKSILTNPKIEN
jgi:hypothetical protein